jgi:xanthine dehydrogenase iron-sulfur cluster and FAD-binding subunit A
MLTVLGKGSTIITLNVNGEDKEVKVKPSDILLNTLRSELGLTDAKPGCENGKWGLRILYGSYKWLAYKILFNAYS